MEASELIRRYDGAHIGDCLLRKAFVMLANSSTKSATQFLEVVEGMANYDNYVSEYEAMDLTSRFLNADGTEGAKWTPDTLFDKVTSLGAEIERAPKFNKWALYVTMNMISSDYGQVIAKWTEGDADRYAEACYELAVARLCDKDNPKWIREYFHL